MILIKILKYPGQESLGSLRIFKILTRIFKDFAQTSCKGLYNIFIIFITFIIFISVKDLLQGTRGSGNHKDHLCVSLIFSFSVGLPCRYA